MRARCYTPSNNRYKYYGACGISVCPSWRKSFASFIKDMGPCPDGCSLGRIKNSKNYTPDNCRWETREQQANNKSNNRAITVRGVTLNLAQWIRRTGISETTVYKRLNQKGWSIEKTLSTPTKKYTTHE